LGSETPLTLFCGDPLHLFQNKKFRISVVQSNADLTQTTTLLSDDIEFPRTNTDMKWVMTFINTAMAMHGAALEILVNRPS
jgi:hypothetical protein